MQDRTAKQTIQLFWHHATRYKRLLIPLLLVLPFTILLQDFLLPYITSQVLQKISEGSFDRDNLFETFGGYIAVYAAATILAGVIGWRLTIWLVWRLELLVSRDIAQRIFEHLIRLSANFHANRFAGSLVSQGGKLVGSYVRFTDATLFNLYTLAISMVAAIVILTPRVPLYAAGLVALSLVYVACAVFFSRPVRTANRLEAEAQSQQTGYLADSIANVMAIKSFAASRHENVRYRQSATHTHSQGINTMRATARRETYASMVTSAISIGALLIAVLAVGMFDADVATVFLVVSYTAVIGSRLWEFQNVLRQYNRALGDASDMVKILQIEPDIKDPVSPEPSRILHGAIDFTDMTFTHPEADDALFSKLNLNIKAGEKIGLVGHSGSGKTTLTKLLLRFSDIDSGAITVDGQDIRAIAQDDLRRAIAYVPQEPLLFHRSIRENIAYGKPDATDAEIAEAARKAHAAEFIAKLPQGYDTLVGERGVKLSGGQRQRIAIARAILKNSPILVLDEATSALDSESERLIQDALRELMKSRTAIVIAHRLSTVQKMDRIVVMQDGKIIEQGPHAKLLAKRGVYSELWAHQSGGFIEE